MSTRTNRAAQRHRPTEDIGPALRNFPSRPKTSRSPAARKRDILRLLKRENLPPTVRQQQERLLGAVERELDLARLRETERKFSKRYKMVRFFEKRKISRSIDNRVRQLTMDQLDTAERDKLAADVRDLQAKLQYVVYFPKTEAYLSLFPSSGELSAQACERQNEIMANVQQAVREGKLSAIGTKKHADLSAIVPSLPMTTTTTLTSKAAVTEEMQDRSMEDMAADDSEANGNGDIQEMSSRKVRVSKKANRQKADADKPLKIKSGSIKASKEALQPSEGCKDDMYGTDDFFVTDAKDNSQLEIQPELAPEHMLARVVQKRKKIVDETGERKASAKGQKKSKKVKEK